MDRRLLHEIEHGRRISAEADTAWERTGKANAVRLKRKADMLLRGIGPRQTVLEVGCGTGLLTAELAKTGAKIYAIDISPDLLSLARERVKSSEVEFFCANAYSLAFEEKTFDFVIGLSVLHHLDIDRALCEFWRVLREGGKVVFSEPNMLNPQIILERSFFRKYFKNSPDETAFIRFLLKRKLEKIGYKNVIIYPFDFLHPRTPDFLTGYVDALSRLLEKVPVISEIAGSLYIETTK